MIDPSPGDIGLVTMRGVAGRWIRLGQWLNGDGYRNYEHAFVYIGNGQLVEATPSGARKAPLSSYDASSVLWLRCPLAFQHPVASAAQGLIGTPYSWLDYASLAAHRFRIPVPGLRAYIRTTGHMICSQLADAAAQLGGWHLFTDNRWPGDVTPGDLSGLALHIKTLA